MSTIRPATLAGCMLLLASLGCDNGGGSGDDAYEENDTTATAYDLSAYEDTWLTEIAGPGILVGTGAPIDLDYYLISLGSGSNVVIECTFTHAVSDINISLLDSWGVVATAQTMTDDESIDIYLSSGDYYIEIWNLEDGTAQYDLRWYTY